ncbi:MAG: PIN domain-containing protein [Spirochaetales bacterium]|nr:PIN domain-containing protein [Spirochaetales bacterium]
MIYLDTHVVVWVYQKDRSRFTPEALALIDREELLISPMVELELEFLFEIDLINVRAEIIIDYLKDRIGLKICENSFPNMIQKAILTKWTRDPFDRIITAHAAVNDSILITKDRQIRKHYSKATW